MKTRWTILAVLLGAPFVFAQEPPQGPEVTLKFKAPSSKEKQPRLMLNGTANFPEGTVLRLSLTRQLEALINSRLTPASEPSVGGLAEVKGKKFEYAPLLSGPGYYTVRVELVDHFQRKEVLDSLKGKVSNRTWQFTFPSWGDDLVGQLGVKLGELTSIVKDCQDIITKMEKVAVSESSWIKEKKNVDARGADIVLTKEAQDIMKDGTKVLTRLDRMDDCKIYFPAAYAEISLTLRNLLGSSQHFSWEAGKFAGSKSYHSPTEMMKTHRSETFNFETAKRYMDEATPIAGREMALWIVKDLQRTEGQVRPEITDALKLYGSTPGLSFIADRLGKATLADLKGFEDEIRKPIVEEKKDDKKDPAKKPEPPKK